jgi:(p)ppGpp synthase/HD superfamily hydrolase
MNQEQLLAKAIKIASDEFECTLDKGGNPYILHCLAVMYGVQYLGSEVMIAAILHDLLEDCKDWNENRLKEEGFSDYSIQLIKLCTHQKNEDYLTYIGRISTDKNAIEIKLSDLRHNMRPDRLIDLSDKSMERIKKYHTAYNFLLGKKEK